MKPLSEVVPGFGHSDPDPNSVNLYQVVKVKKSDYKLPFFLPSNIFSG